MVRILYNHKKFALKYSKISSMRYKQVVFIYLFIYLFTWLQRLVVAASDWKYSLLAAVKMCPRKDFAL